MLIEAESQSESGKEKKLDIPGEVKPIANPKSAENPKPAPKVVHPPAKTQKKPSGLLGFLIFLVILILVGYFGFRTYLLIQYKPQTGVGKIELQTTEELQRIQATTQFTNPVSTSEPTGRADPLAPF